MPTLTIDGKQVEVSKGTRIIEAAKKLGIDVPYYCYHPGLSIAGNCRMCLVEIEKMPKLQIACHIEATDGMVVKTATEKVLKTRQHVLEFLLVNHPLDCPVCDQAGECWLQDYYMRHGLYDSRVNENKVKKPKAVPVGPTIMLDAERCILCSRCVRFTDEISKTSELGIVKRGDHSEIQVFPNKELNNPYSGNVADICPVGALTDRDFRFKIRVWYLESQDSLCNGCARGCNIQVHYNLDRPHHGKGDRVMRLKPRYNEHINQWWMCDEGRYGYKFHDQNRILSVIARVRSTRSNDVQEVKWDKVLSEVAKRIHESEGKFGVCLSPQLSNEELYLAKKIFTEAKGKLFLVSPKTLGYEDDFLIRADKNPNTKGAELLGLTPFKGEAGFEGMIIFGQDLLSDVGAPLVGALSSKTGQAQGLPLQHLRWSVFIGSNQNLTSESATYVLPAATYLEKEGTFTNFEGRIQYFPKVLEPLEESQPEWKILTDLGKKMGRQVHYDRAEEIFQEFAAAVGMNPKPTYSALQTGGSDIRALASPVIPALEQEANIL